MSTHHRRGALVPQGCYTARLDMDTLGLVVGAHEGLQKLLAAQASIALTSQEVIKLSL